jgi:hypothetical protein
MPKCKLGELGLYSVLSVPSVLSGFKVYFLCSVSLCLCGEDVVFLNPLRYRLP